MKNHAQSQSPALARLFEDLENGNITVARKAARGHTAFRLSMFARQTLFWSFDRATKAAAYLKGEAGFQEHCDADRATDGGESWERMAMGGDSGPSQPSF